MIVVILLIFNEINYFYITPFPNNVCVWGGETSDSELNEFNSCKSMSVQWVMFLYEQICRRSYNTWEGRRGRDNGLQLMEFCFCFHSKLPNVCKLFGSALILHIYKRQQSCFCSSKEDLERWIVKCIYIFVPVYVGERFYGKTDYAWLLQMVFWPSCPLLQGWLVPISQFRFKKLQDSLPNHRLCWRNWIFAFSLLRENKISLCPDVP